MAYTPQIYYPQQNNYIPQYQQQYQQTQAQQQQNNNGLIWVSGEIGAKSYLVAPNTSVLLMDSEGDKFYLKSTDSAGMPSIRTFVYSECTPNSVQATQSAQKALNEQFVTREEYDELRAIIEELRKPKTTAKKKEVVENE